MRYRSGIGYDVHQFAEGRPLILGGVDVPHFRGLSGHSDADVLSHAIADAILGAIGQPDIGYWFPPTDDSIEGISSLIILEKAAELVRERGGEIENIDSTLIAEAPKVMKHAPAMKEKIAEALGMDALKKMLQSRGVKCGGTLRERAERAMAVRGLDDADIPAKLRARQKKRRRRE